MGSSLDWLTADLKGSTHSLSHHQRSIHRSSDPYATLLECVRGLRKFGRLYRNDVSAFPRLTKPPAVPSTESGAFGTPAWPNPGNRMTESQSHVAGRPPIHAESTVFEDVPGFHPFSKMGGNPQPRMIMAKLTVARWSSELARTVSQWQRENRSQVVSRFQKALDNTRAN